MDVLALVLAAAVALAAVALVARPLLRAEADDALAEPGERTALVEARDRALAALKELEFDHRTGKVSDADYQAAVGPLRREVAEALRTLDPPAKPAVDVQERVASRD
jgi:hypothetical protein